MNCACGCGAEVPKARYPSWQSRYIHNHHRQKSPVEYVVDANGCWIWQRYLDECGYGRRGYGNRKTGHAHRFYYEQKYGAVPQGCELHHICEVKRCVNPDHLEPVTRLNHRRRHPRGNEVSWAS